MRNADDGEKRSQAADHSKAAKVVDGARPWPAQQIADEQGHGQHQHDQWLHDHHRAGRKCADLQQEAEEVAGDRHQPARVEQEFHQAARVLITLAGAVGDVVLDDDRGAVDDGRAHAERDGDS